MFCKFAFFWDLSLWRTASETVLTLVNRGAADQGCSLWLVNHGSPWDFDGLVSLYIVCVTSSSLLAVRNLVARTAIKKAKPTSTTTGTGQCVWHPPLDLGKAQRLTETDPACDRTGCSYQLFESCSMRKPAHSSFHR